MPAPSFVQRAQQRGFSLIELLLVLGVLAVFLITAFVFYPQVRDRNQANAEATNLTAIKANINNLYASKSGNYRGLNQAVANQARAFPVSMNGNDFSSSAAITSSWGSPVSIAVNAAPTTTTQTPGRSLGANRSFSVTYTDVPAGVCLPLVTAAAMNFQGVRVGSTEVMTGGGAGGQIGFDPSIASGACVDGAATVVFTSS